MKFLCPHGCKNPDGTPKLHASKRFCPVEVAYRREHGRWMGQPDRTDPDRERAKGSAPGAAMAPGAKAPPAAPAKVGKGITIGYRPAVVVGPGVELAAAGQINLEWEVSEQTCERFWSTVISGIEQLCDWFCDLLLIPKVPAGTFVLDEGQKYVIRTTFRGFTTNILQKVFRAKTPEDADRIVAGIGGIVGFGLMFLKVVWHFIKEVPKSPRLEKLRERRAKIRAEREAAELERRRAQGENVPPAKELPGIVPGRA